MAMIARFMAMKPSVVAMISNFVAIVAHFMATKSSALAMIARFMATLALFMATKCASVAMLWHGVAPFTAAHAPTAAQRVRSLAHASHSSHKPPTALPRATSPNNH